MTPAAIARLLIFALAGFALGGASYATLKLNTVLYLSGDRWRSAVLHFFRLALLVAILVWAARQGAGPLLAMAAGLVVARPVVVPILARLK